MEQITLEFNIIMSDLIFTAYGLGLIIAILILWAIGSTLVNKAYFKKGSWSIDWLPMKIGWDPLDIYTERGKKVGSIDLIVVRFSISYGWSR